MHAHKMQLATTLDTDSRPALAMQLYPFDSQLWRLMRLAAVCGSADKASRQFERADNLSSCGLRLVAANFELPASRQLHIFVVHPPCLQLTPPRVTFRGFDAFFGDVSQGSLYRRVLSRGYCS